MIDPKQELVWQGRLHLGDEPGVYGDATFVGINAELPITITMVEQSGSDAIRITLETGAVQTYDDYPGHHIVIKHYEPDTSQPPNHWKESILWQGRLKSTSDNNSSEQSKQDKHRLEIPIDLSGKAKLGKPLFASINVRVDTSVPAGLYDDFLILRLSFQADNYKYYATFGFRS
jgi:hypothetical protein